MTSYNLIVKAENAEDAAAAVDDWLSMPVEQSTSLGYGEYMVNVVSDDVNFTRYLENWKRDTSPEQNGGTFASDALLSWTS